MGLIIPHPFEVAYSNFIINMVKHQSHKLTIVGSNPTSATFNSYTLVVHYGGVAKLVITATCFYVLTGSGVGIPEPDCESGSRRFNSDRSPLKGIYDP